jgi:hypothetical protein
LATGQSYCFALSGCERPSVAKTRTREKRMRMISCCTCAFRWELGGAPWVKKGDRPGTRQCHLRPKTSHPVPIRAVIFVSPTRPRTMPARPAHRCYGPFAYPGPAMSIQICAPSRSPRPRPCSPGLSPPGRAPRPAAGGLKPTWIVR